MILFLGNRTRKIWEHDASKFYLSLIHFRTGADSVIELVDRCECVVTNVTTWLYMKLYGNSSMQTVLM